MNSFCFARVLALVLPLACAACTQTGNDAREVRDTAFQVAETPRCAALLAELNGQRSLAEQARSAVRQDPLRAAALQVLPDALGALVAPAVRLQDDLVDIAAWRLRHEGCMTA